MIAVEMFFAKNEDYLQAIEVNDVYFFTVENGKVIAVLKNRRLQLSTSLFLVNELLGKRETFFRCHKSYIVNLSKIAYSGSSGHLIRRHPDTKPETSGQCTGIIRTLVG